MRWSTARRSSSCRPAARRSRASTGASASGASARRTSWGDRAPRAGRDRRRAGLVRGPPPLGEPVPRHILWALPRLPAAVTSLTLTIQPIASVALGAVLLGQQPSVLQLAGV